MFLAADISANLGFERFCCIWIEFGLEVWTFGFSIPKCAGIDEAIYIRAMLPVEVQELLVLQHAHTLCLSFCSAWAVIFANQGFPSGNEDPRSLQGQRMAVSKA